MYLSSPCILTFACSDCRRTSHYIPYKKTFVCRDYTGKWMVVSNPRSLICAACSGGTGGNGICSAPWIWSLVRHCLSLLPMPFGLTSMNFLKAPGFSFSSRACVRVFVIIDSLWSQSLCLTHTEALSSTDSRWRVINL